MGLSSSFSFFLFVGGLGEGGGGGWLLMLGEGWVGLG